MKLGLVVIAFSCVLAAPLPRRNYTNIAVGTAVGAVAGAVVSGTIAGLALRYIPAGKSIVTAGKSAVMQTTAQKMAKPLIVAETKNMHMAPLTPQEATRNQFLLTSHAETIGSNVERFNV